MKQRSSTIEGFRLMFSRPALGLAEIAWRWTFGATATLAFSFLAIEYFRTLPVSAADIFLLRTRHPLLISQALAHIFQGSGVRIMRAGAIALVLLSVAWIGLASLGRSIAVSAVLSYVEDDLPRKRSDNSRTGGTIHRYGSTVGLNFLRVIAGFGALTALLAALVLAGAVSPAKNPSPGTSLLLFLMLISGISLAWWLLNWILSLASIFAVAEGSGTFAAISQAIELWRLRWGSLVVAGTWFGLAHAIVFFVATCIVAFPLAFVGVLPGGVVFGGLLLVALMYFAVSDFLYAGKMAAYVAIAAFPEERFEVSRSSASSTLPGAIVDRDELILCDIPSPL